jgi:hypothetical protein
MNGMFIIFGFRGITYSKERGTFDCPYCREQTSYVRKRIRRFFTLFFIPLIPLDLLLEYVECQRCCHTCRPEVLSLKAELAGNH